MLTPKADDGSSSSPPKETDCEGGVSLTPIVTDAMSYKETEGLANTEAQNGLSDSDELPDLQLLAEECQAHSKQDDRTNDFQGDAKTSSDDKQNYPAYQHPREAEGGFFLPKHDNYREPCRTVREELQELIEIDEDSEAQVPSDRPSHRKRKRSGNDNSKKKKRRQKNKKKQHKKDLKNPRPSRKDPLYDYNPKVLQPPTPADFVGYGSLSREQWQFGPAPEPRVVLASDDDKEFVSAPSRIADPYDDTRTRRPVFNQDVDEVEETGAADEDGPEEEEPRRATTGHFMNIPSEIREEIYHYILVVEAPILVRAGWKRIYARRRPGIDTAILRVNELIYSEATRILYGKNTFLYRLRDPTNRVVNVWELSNIDHKERDAPDPEDADDDDETDPKDGEFKPGGEEYDAEDEDVDEYPARTGRSRRRTRSNERVRVKNDTIDITKFGCYFRQLIVEAERNRFSNKTQVAMAEAIKIFIVKPGRLRKTCSGGVKTNIKTFTIRVAPKYQLSDQSLGKFTFVDFFKAQSPVWNALKSLPCRFIRIDISTAFLNGGKDPRFCRLTIDMQSHRFSRFAARQCTIPGVRSSWRTDLWRHDRIVGAQRNAKSAKCLAALEALADHVTKACDKHLSEHIKAAVELYEEEEYDQGVDWGSEDGGNDDIEEFVPESEVPEVQDEDTRD